MVNRQRKPAIRRTLGIDVKKLGAEVVLGTAVSVLLSDRLVFTVAEVISPTICSLDSPAAPDTVKVNTLSCTVIGSIDALTPAILA